MLNPILQVLFQSAQHLHEKREGSESGSVPLPYGSRSGSWRPKNMRIRIRIPNTGLYFIDSPIIVLLNTEKFSSLVLQQERLLESKNILEKCGCFAWKTVILLCYPPPTMVWYLIVFEPYWVIAKYATRLVRFLSFFWDKSWIRDSYFCLIILLTYTRYVLFRNQCILWSTGEPRISWLFLRMTHIPGIYGLQLPK